MIATLALGGNAALAQTLPTPSHVVILWEENYAYSEIIGSSSAPHINALAANPNAAVFTQFYAIEHPSQPNYLDFFSGSNQGITDDGLPSSEVSDYPFTSPNLCAELQSAGKTFTQYSEDLPAVGSDVEFYTAGGANYARKHNPCTNWVGTGANQFAATVNQPYTAFPTAANYSTLPTVTFVVPNMTNDMHDYTCSSLPCPESITLGDNWMYNNLDSLRAWSLANNTLYIVIYDEDDDYHSNNIPVIFYGPMVKGGTYTENINHYNLLHTIESMYGLGHAGASATSTSITDCWLSSTAVKNVEGNHSAFTVSPNPASDVITFSCASLPTTLATITINDALGRKVGTYNMPGNTLEIATSSFKKGIYSYAVTDANGVRVADGKFVIAR